MRETLKLFLELPGVFDVINNYQLNIFNNENVSIMSNIVNGEIWCKIKNIFLNEIVFPIVLYFDDFETLNPLGSHAGCYKIGIMYFTIATIPPEYASRLENIFLTHIFYSNDRTQFGNKKIFQPVIEELKFLETEGISIQVGIKSYKIKFVLAELAGDNLGLHAILGLHESFSSTYFCRFCTETKEVIKTSTYESIQNLRKKEDYPHHVLTKIGIKEICLWNDLSYFHVYENLTCDVMHDIYEGVLRYDMAVIIHKLIEQNFFNLSRLNQRIKFYNYDSAEKNRPPPINNDHLIKGCIIMSAAEMVCLFTNFRFIIGDLVPENSSGWSFYLVALEMVNKLSSQTISCSSLDQISNIVQKHNELYLDLSGDGLKPKFHWLLHYPRIIKKIGPPKLISGMRFEAKHKEFKSIAQSIRCRKNVPYSLAIKSQLKTCHRLTSLIGLSDRMSLGTVADVDQNDSIYFNKYGLYINDFFLTSWYNINGITYKENSILIINDTLDLPVFFSLQKIYVKQNNLKCIYFIGSILNTLGYCKHYSAYEIKKTDDCDLKSINMLSSKLPVYIRNVGDSWFIDMLNL